MGALARLHPITPWHVRSASQLARANMSLPRGRACVYFIQSGEHGPVKIGFATDIHCRLANLQPGNPEWLVCIGWIEGGRELEAKLHEEFEFYRLRGEWFLFAGDLRAFVEREAVRP